MFEAESEVIGPYCDNRVVVRAIMGSCIREIKHMFNSSVGIDIGKENLDVYLDNKGYRFKNDTKGLEGTNVNS